jgi:phospholipid/cholesterol/gamma-HCH transport system permease protein
MVAGRVGAAMAAEIGTMRVTDQIDALTTLSTNPMKYLVAPRLLAGTLALPLLVLVADTLGVMGGSSSAPLKLGFNSRSTCRTRSIFCKRWMWWSAGQGRGVRLPGRADGLLPRLQQPRRRRGRGGGHHERGGGRRSILILAFDYVLTELFFAR